MPRDTITDLENFVNTVRDERDHAQSNGIISLHMSVIRNLTLPLSYPNDTTHEDAISKPGLIRPRCSFCKSFGLTTEDCRNYAKRTSLA